MRIANLAAMGLSFLVFGSLPTLVSAADADASAAAPAEEAGLEEIVVTAEKRASTVQDTLSTSPASPRRLQASP
jgi:hypothetical protein